MTPEAIARKYQRAVDRLLELATAMPDDLRAGRIGNGAWSIREVLAHLTFWDQFYIPILEAAHAGQPYDLDEGDVDAHNAEAVASRAGLAWDDLLQEVTATRDRRIRLHLMPCEIDFSDAGDHWDEHREEIERWLAQWQDRYGANTLTPGQISTRFAERSGTVLEIADSVPEELRNQPGVCGVWSVKDVLGHLAFWASVTLDALAAASGAMEWQPDSRDEDTINAEQAALRARWTWDQVLDEARHNRLRRVSLHLLPCNDDMTEVGSHWLEHGAQIDAWISEHVGAG